MDLTHVVHRLKILVCVESLLGLKVELISLKFTDPELVFTYDELGIIQIEVYY